MCVYKALTNSNKPKNSNIVNNGTSNANIFYNQKGNSLRILEQVDIIDNGVNETKKSKCKKSCYRSIGERFFHKSLSV